MMAESLGWIEQKYELKSAFVGWETKYYWCFVFGVLWARVSVPRRQEVDLSSYIESAQASDGLS